MRRWFGSWVDDSPSKCDCGVVGSLDDTGCLATATSLGVGRSRSCFFGECAQLLRSVLNRLVVPIATRPLACNFVATLVAAKEKDFEGLHSDFLTKVQLNSNELCLHSTRLVSACRSACVSISVSLHLTANRGRSGWSSLP